jgi:hypothetical protein
MLLIPVVYQSIYSLNTCRLVLLQAFNGLAVHGFPNLFFIMGPNTILGHNSVILMIEAQVDYIMQIIMTMRQHCVSEVEVVLSQQQSFNKELKDKVVNTVWSAGGCKSWYLNENNKNTVLWPGFTQSFISKTKNADSSSFHWRRRKSNVIGKSEQNEYLPLEEVPNCDIAKVRYIDEQYGTNYFNFFVAFFGMLAAQYVVGNTFLRQSSVVA